MKEANTVYISMGSNLGNRVKYLQDAVLLVCDELGPVGKISKVYQSTSWGFEAGDFLNACMEVSTHLKPIQVMEKLLSIEQKLGRERKREKGYESRGIDLDLLYYGEVVLSDEQLTLPHPKLQDRRFVLMPLADIAPQFYHPLLKKDTRNLLQECKDQLQVEKTRIRLYPSNAAFFASLDFVAIEGNIGAGKTTLAHKIAGDFDGKLVLERFADNPFLPKFYEDQQRYAFPLEMSFLADRYQQFTDDTTQFDLFKQFMVSDYDIYKSLIFAQVTLQKEEFQLYRKLFNLMYREVKKPHIYVYLYQSTERLLQNIKQRGRAYEQSIEGEYLSRINQGYFDFFKSFPEQNTLIIDVGELDFVAREEDYNAIITTIRDYALNLSF